MDERGQRARLSLAGLSVGDALGERFFGPPLEVVARIERRELPTGTWTWTDDTEMALSIVETLDEAGTIDPDLLAWRFADRYDPARGYGGGAHGLLQALRRGAPWRQAAAAMFGGTGSYGNGAAMRVAPVGAYLADDLDAVVEAALASARVTHAHPEGAAGAVAVAVAAAAAHRAAAAGDLDPGRLFDEVLARTPPGETRDGLAAAAALPASTSPEEAARRLGSGSRVSAQDTVPFALFGAAHHLGDFEEAFWATVRGLGDRDTTSAITCGVVALSAPRIPPEWLAAREPLPPGFAPAA